MPQTGVCAHSETIRQVRRSRARDRNTYIHTYIHTYKDYVVTATQSANRVNIPKGMTIPTVAMAQVNEPVLELEELNGTIWSKTPYDILNLVIEKADRATQAIWSRTGSAFHEVSSVLPWKEIFIHVKDLQTYWERTRTRPPLFNVRPDREWRDGRFPHPGSQPTETFHSVDS